MLYMTHPQHGAMHVVDFGESEKLKASGWSVTKEPTAQEIQALKKGVAASALRAQLAELEAADAAAPVVKNKPGRKPKVVA